MRIGIVGPWSARGPGEENRIIAETLCELGHAVTPLPGWASTPLSGTQPIFAGITPLVERTAQAQLERSLFQYDAVVVSGTNIDHGRVLRAARGKPVIVWEHGRCDLLDCLSDDLCKDNVTFVSGSEERTLKTRKRGRRAFKIERPARGEDREGFKRQLTELLEGSTT